MIAETAAAATFAWRTRLVWPFFMIGAVRLVAAWPGSAIAVEPALEVAAAFRAANPPQRVTHCFAGVIPLFPLAMTGILDFDRRRGLLGVMRAEQPAFFQGGIGLFRVRGVVGRGCAFQIDAGGFFVENYQVINLDLRSALK